MVDLVWKYTLLSYVPSFIPQHSSAGLLSVPQSQSQSFTRLLQEHNIEDVSIKSLLRYGYCRGVDPVHMTLLMLSFLLVISTKNPECLTKLLLSSWAFSAHQVSSATVNSSPEHQAQGSRKQPAGAEAMEKSMKELSDWEDCCRTGTTWKSMVWTETESEEMNLGVSWVVVVEKGAQGREEGLNKWMKQPEMTSSSPGGNVVVTESV